VDHELIQIEAKKSIYILALEEGQYQLRQEAAADQPMLCPRVNLSAKGPNIW